jgi:hypothetical protein
MRLNCSVSNIRLDVLREATTFPTTVGFWEGLTNLVKLLNLVKAAVGIEPTNKGFADLCLTTWLRRREMVKSERGAMN